MTQAENGQVNVSYNHQTLQSEPTHSASFHFNAFMALHQSILYVLLCICALSFIRIRFNKKLFCLFFQ